jgi:hypothetical protein
MFGPKLNTVFASRWRAIWFSASVCLFAWLVVPADEPGNATQSTLEAVNATAAESGLSPEGQKQVEEAVKALESVSGAD